MDDLRCFHRDGVDAGGGQTEENVVFGRRTVFQNLPGKTGLLFQAAAFGGSLVEHERLIENGGYVGQPAGAVEGLLRQNVGVAAAKNVDQTVPDKDGFHHLRRLYDFLPLGLPDGGDGGGNMVGILV